MNLSRRMMLHESALAFGTLALRSLMAEDRSAADSRLHSVVQPDHQPTASSVIFLFMAGGPGQTDTFDPKPLLTDLDGQRVPESIAATVPNIPRSGVDSRLFASPFTFRPFGESGIPVSSLYPETGQLTDDLCVIRSLNHRVPVHGPGECIAFTGTGVGDRPSMGAWTTYGLGSEARNLPGFVVFQSGGSAPPAQLPGWSSGFLPAQYQGTLVDSDHGVPYTQMPDVYNERNRRQQLDFIREMNRRHLQRFGPDSELEARVASYELGYRLQSAAPEVFDVSSETLATRELYGLDQPDTAEFGKQCLLARRLVERGVRCIQLRNGGWDAHSSLKPNHLKSARSTDRPIAALLRDLKQRGLLESTLVVWGGEFGRTPTIEGSRTGDSRGRDHSPAGYTMWLAGGGVKGGQVIGETDEIGWGVAKDPVHVHDMHATILHLFGLDHERFTYRFQGRDFRITDVSGQLVKQLVR